MTQERGCGFRAENGLYACVPTSPFGRPLEWFLVDPVKPWKGGSLRAPMIIQDPRTKIKHLVLGIGATYYPFVPDFVEETRRLGISKRIPVNYDFSQLTPGKSGLVLVHPRAIPEFDYHADYDCPKKNFKPTLHSDGSECIGALWPLSGLHSEEKVHEVETQGDDSRLITTPSASYDVSLAYEMDGQLMTEPHVKDYHAGAIFFFPSFHLEYVNSEKQAPEDLAKPLMAQGWPFYVEEE